jgi:hypothetical protein
MSSEMATEKNETWQSELKDALRYLDAARGRAWVQLERACLKLLWQLFGPMRHVNVHFFPYMLVSFTEKVEAGAVRRPGTFRLGSVKESLEWGTENHYRARPQPYKPTQIGVSSPYESAAKALSKTLLERSFNKNNPGCIGFLMERHEKFGIHSNVHSIGLLLVFDKKRAVLEAHDAGGLRGGQSIAEAEAAILKSFLAFLFGNNSKDPVKNNKFLPSSLRNLSCKLVQVAPEDLSEARCYVLANKFVIQAGELMSQALSSTTASSSTLEVTRTHTHTLHSHSHSTLSVLVQIKLHKRAQDFNLLQLEYLCKSNSTPLARAHRILTYCSWKRLCMLP